MIDPLAHLFQLYSDKFPCFSQSSGSVEIRTFSKAQYILIASKKYTHFFFVSLGEEE